jgi:hypothetical protein
VEGAEVTLAAVVRKHRDQPQPTFLNCFIHDLEADPDFNLRERVEALAESYDQPWGRQHHLDTGARVAEKLRAILQGKNP